MTNARNVAVGIVGLATCIVLLLAPSRAAPGLSGYGLGLPVDPLQAFEAIASYRSVCADEYLATFNPAEREELDRGRLRSYDFELARLRKIDRSADETTRRASLDGYLAKIGADGRANLQRAGCANDQTKKFILGHARALLDSKTFDHVTRVIETGMPYDAPRPISAQTGAPASFASPDLVFVAMHTLRTNSKCGSVDIDAVTLESKAIAPAANKPPYVRDPQNIAEVWSWACDGVMRKHRLTFRQDDRKTWRYAIQPISP